MKHAEQLFIKINALVFFIIMIIINFTNQAEISAISQVNKPFIQPVGFTFAIWSVIYIWLFAWLLFSFFKSAPSLYEDLKYLLPLNFTFNALWVLTYTAGQFLLSCIVITLVLITVALIYIKLYQHQPLSWFMTGVFSIYLGWISVATTVNIFSYLNKLEPPVWTQMEQLTATIIALVTIVLFAIYMLVRINDFFILLTIIWSLFGIALNKSNVVLSVVCYSLIAILLALLIIYVFRAKSYKKTSK